MLGGEVARDGGLGGPLGRLGTCLRPGGQTSPSGSPERLGALGVRSTASLRGQTVDPRPPHIEGA
ncbi:hypothetical protein VULLAG_LOCUS17438 [Vulpes lagopus]